MPEIPDHAYIVASTDATMEAYMEHTSRRLAALRLFMVHGLGLRSANALIKHFKDPLRAIEATCKELESLGVPPEVGDDLLSPKSRERADAEWGRAEQLHSMPPWQSGSD